MRKTLPENNWEKTSDGQVNWKTLGFFQGFDYDKQPCLGMAFNKLYDYLKKIPDEAPIAVKLKERNKLTCLFPILRRIVDMCPIEKCTLKSPKKFVAFFVDYWDEYYPAFKNRSGDTEAIICVAFADIIIKTIMDGNE